MKSSIKQRLIPEEEKESEDLVVQQISTSDKENDINFKSHQRDITNSTGFKHQSSRIPVPTQQPHQQQFQQATKTTKSQNSTFNSTANHKNVTPTLTSKPTKTPSVEATKPSLNAPSHKLQSSVLAATPRAQQLLIDQVSYLPAVFSYLCRWKEDKNYSDSYLKFLHVSHVFKLASKKCTLS